MMSRSVAFALLASALTAGALGDVPKGYCHDCEVTCMEDCAFKYDREIITPDLTDTNRLSRKDTRVEAAMKKRLSGVVLLTKRQTDVPALVKSYGSCLEAEQCPCNRQPAARQGLQLIARRTNKTRCAVGEKSCALGCVSKVLDSSSLLQGGQSVRPEPSDDAAIPWSVNVHPVKINTFATGRQNLQQCFKSCLAATCGCEDAPGMDAIEDMHAAVTQNHQAQDPVEDTPPMAHYEKATITECGKGIPGKKVTSGLYANFGGGPSGWAEICSTKFFENMGLAADAAAKNCENDKALLAGCVWDDTMGECVYGLKKMIRCYTSYYRDEGL